MLYTTTELQELKEIMNEMKNNLDVYRDSYDEALIDLVNKLDGYNGIYTIYDFTEYGLYPIIEDGDERLNEYVADFVRDRGIDNLKRILIDVSEATLYKVDDYGYLSNIDEADIETVIDAILRVLEQDLEDAKKEDPHN